MCLLYLFLRQAGRVFCHTWGWVVCPSLQRRCYGETEGMESSRTVWFKPLFQDISCVFYTSACKSQPPHLLNTVCDMWAVLCLASQLCPRVTVARQAPPSMGFSRHGYWSGLPFPPPGDLLDPGVEPASPASAGRFFTTAATWETHVIPTLSMYPSTEGSL